MPLSRPLTFTIRSRPTFANTFFWSRHVQDRVNRQRTPNQRNFPYNSGLLSRGICGLARILGFRAGKPWPKVHYWCHSVALTDLPEGAGCKWPAGWPGNDFSRAALKLAGDLDVRKPQ